MPDFIIRHKYEEVPFGVEVTEVHQSDSDARLRHIPNYFSEVIRKEEYRHKDDKNILKVEDVSVTSAEGEDKGSVRAIVRELPSAEDYVQMFVQVLRKKEARVKDYGRGLNHVNLIVLDNIHKLVASRVKDFYWHLFTLPLKEALYASGFREVFLITIPERERWVYVPLKLMLLLADTYMFPEIAAKLLDEPSEGSSAEPGDSTKDFMLTFAAYVRSKTDKVRTRDDNGQIEVIFGNSGTVLEEERILIRDYNDYPCHEDVRTVGEDETTVFSSMEFLEMEKEIWDNYVFSTETAYDLKGEVRF